jgi:DNA modification methylase
MKINEIYLGDCLELMKDIPNGTIDMILIKNNLLTIQV